MVVFLGAVGFVALLLVLPLVGTLGGMFGGWVLALFGLDWMALALLSKFGITGMPLWQIGGGLGFLGGFFKSIQTNTNNK